jgi:benzoylformate decarboxylase
LGWGSDAIAALLSELDFKYVALVPGASYRGLHDSLVNYLGNRNPQMLVCLHEEHAIAIAQGYAKVTDKPMLACVHSNVGLMHATMAIYNAWCDRMPMVILGATGPGDANARRPWIDWIHTSKDQGALVRHYTKWDDEPRSVPAALQSILRARQIALTPPFGPTYVCLDVEMQEERLESGATLPAPERYRPAQAAAAPTEAIETAADWLAQAERPLVLCGRVSRDEGDWAARVALCEAIGGIVLTDLRNSAAFPSEHPLHVVEPRARPSAATIEAVSKADVILALDWLDLAGLLKVCEKAGPITGRIINVSADSYIHNGWSMDHPIQATPDAVTRPLREAVERRNGGRQFDVPKWCLESTRSTIGYSEDKASPDTIGLRDFAECVSMTLRDIPVSYTRFSLGWPGHVCRFEGPLDYLGNDGGGGVGSGPGVSVGAALALRGSGRIPVAILGDGDYLMGVNALWTAARGRIPLLVVVANNRAYHNDEVHQAHMARTRGRTVENKWIGQKIDDPAVDLVAMARAQGFTAEGAIATLDALPDALRRGVDIVRAGGCHVIEVLTIPGYADSAGGRSE